MKELSGFDIALTPEEMMRWFFNSFSKEALTELCEELQLPTSSFKSLMVKSLIDNPHLWAGRFVYTR